MPITAEEVTRIPLGDDSASQFKYPYALIYRADLHQRAARRLPAQSDLITLRRLAEGRRRRRDAAPASRSRTEERQDL